MCGCDCCIYDKIIHSLLLSCSDQYLKKLKDQSLDSQNRSSGEKENRIYEIYKNIVIPHERHIYAKSSDVEKAAMCEYTQYNHALPHWKFIFRCCNNCQCINLTDHEKYNQYADITPSIRFRTYHVIVCCNAHGRITLKYRKIYCMCKQESSSDNSTKLTPENT